MGKNLEKFLGPDGRVSPEGFSPEEIFQLLKENPEKFSHQIKTKEREFYRFFFDFFIDYFYLKGNAGLKDFINSLERAILVKMLDRFNGNQRITATFLGVNHTTLNQKVRKHKINFFKKPVEG